MEEGIKDKALRYRNLKKDDTFVELIDQVKMAQTAVFLDPHSSEEALVKARAVVIALEAIDTVFQGVFDQEAVFDKQNN